LAIGASCCDRVKSEVQPSPLCTNDTPRLTIRSFVDSGILSQWRHAAAGGRDRSRW